MTESQIILSLVLLVAVVVIYMAVHERANWTSNRAHLQQLETSLAEISRLVHESEARVSEHLVSFASNVDEKSNTIASSLTLHMKQSDSRFAELGPQLQDLSKAAETVASELKQSDALTSQKLDLITKTLVDVTTL